MKKDLKSQNWDKFDFMFFSPSPCDDGSLASFEMLPLRAYQSKCPHLDKHLLYRFRSKMALLLLFLFSFRYDVDSKSPDLSKHVSAHIFNLEPQINGGRSSVKSKLLAWMALKMEKVNITWWNMMFKVI